MAHMPSQSIKIFKMFAPPAGVITININLCTTFPKFLRTPLAGWGGGGCIRGPGI